MLFDFDFNVNICRFCQKILCCAECRIVHEKNDHLAEVENKTKFANLCFYTVSRPISFRGIEFTVLEHILDHLPVQCLKCFKVTEFYRDVRNTSSCIGGVTKSESSSKNNPYCDLAVKSNEIKTISPVNNFSLIKSSSQNKEIETDVKFVTTTSTPTEKLIFKLYENTFSCGSHCVSSIYNSNNMTDFNPSLIIETSPNISNIISRKIKCTKLSSTWKRTHTPFGHTISRAEIEHPIGKFFHETNQYSSPLRLRKHDCLQKSESCISTRLYYSKNTNGNYHIQQCYSISSKKTTESIFIKSLLNSTPSSIKYKSDTETYESCRSVDLISSKEIETKNLELKTNSNSFQMTPKCSGILRKKAIDFESFKEFDELDQEDIFYTPKSTLHIPSGENCTTKDSENINLSKIKLEKLQNKNIGEKIWDIFSSIIGLPSVNKAEKHTNDVFLEDNIIINNKRKRNFREDLNDCNEMKRPKFIYGRRPLESYKIRLGNIKNKNDLN